MGRLEVTAAAVVLPTVDGREQYLYKGAVVESDAFTEEGLEHARAQGLIGDAPEIVEDESPAVTQADIDDAVAAVQAEAQKVADERSELEAAKADLQKERERLEAEKAELQNSAAVVAEKKPAAAAAKATAKSAN